MKKRIAIFLTLAMLAALFVFPTTASAASQTDLYVSNSGDDTNDGLSAETPKKTMTAAFSAAAAAANTNDVTLHVISTMDITTTDVANSKTFTMDSYTHTLTITGGTIADAHTGAWFLVLGGPTVFKDITIQAAAKGLLLVTDFNRLVMDEGVTVTGMFSIYAGASTSSASPRLHDGVLVGDQEIVIKSGTYTDVSAFRSTCPYDIDGNLTITVSGNDTEIASLVASRACYHTVNNATFYLNGGKIGRFVANCDRKQAELNSNAKCGVADTFVIHVGKDFDFANSFANESSTDTTFIGISGISAGQVDDSFLSRANYVLVLDETLYDTYKEGMDDVIQYDTFDKIVKDAPALRTASLTLDGKIGLNFYVSVSPSFKAANPNGYAKLTGPEGEKTVLLADAPVDANGNSKFTYAVAAKDMREDVTISFFDGNDQPLPLYDSAYNEIAGGSYTYTVGDYLAAVDGDASQSAEMKALAEALSDYNACAELLFGTGTPAVPSLGNMDLSSYKATLTGDLPAGVTLTGMTLLLESETTLRVYFKLADGAALPAVTVDGTDVSPVAKDGQYYIAIENIAAPDLGVAHSIEIGDCTVSASALSYSAAVLANAADNEPLCNTAKALANYYNAADAYFN